MSVEPQTNTPLDGNVDAIKRIYSWAERKGRYMRDERVWFDENSEECMYANLSGVRVSVAGASKHKIAALVCALDLLMHVYPEVYVYGEDDLGSWENVRLYLLMPVELVDARAHTITFDNLTQLAARIANGGRK